MAITETVAQRIRRLRTRQGLNQQELAERCGMHPSSMNQIEQGTRRPSTKTVTALARVLGTTRDAILDGEQTIQASHGISAEIARLRAQLDALTASAPPVVLDLPRGQETPDISAVVQSAIFDALSDILEIIGRAALASRKAAHAAREDRPPADGRAGGRRSR